MALNLTKRSDLFTLSLSLACFCAVAAALLAWVSAGTQGPIEEAKARRASQAMAKVLPPGIANNPSQCRVTVEEVTFSGAFDAGGRLIGVAGSCAVNSGYSGKIELLVGLTPDGAVRDVAAERSAVLVTEHTETPGLGSVVADRKSPKTPGTLFDPPEAMPPNPYLDQYAGKRADPGSPEWRIAKDGGEFEFRTGATVTSRAVTTAVGHITAVYGRNRDAIQSDLRKRNESKPQ